MVALLVGAFIGASAFANSAPGAVKVAADPATAAAATPVEQASRDDKPARESLSDDEFKSFKEAISKPVPETVDDLLAIERRVRRLADDLSLATVNVRIGRAQGSGVIVSKDGYVLTAAHVSGAPGRDCTLILHDGRRVKGKTLGVNRSLDAGMVQITDNPDGDSNSDADAWPFAEMGKSDEVKVGNWVVALGHPGGYRNKRPPVLRLGRVILKRDSMVQSDCTLVGGDSGGPLFDMDGRVIGIHSRIGASTAWNFHVPISAYTDGWDRLVKAEAWGGRTLSQPSPAIIGVQGEDHARGCRITVLSEGLPAAKAGFRVGDVITKFNNKKITGFDSLAQNVRSKKPGDAVKIELIRDGETKTFEVTLAKRPTN